MIKYPKIPTVWLRDKTTNYKTLIEGAWSNAALVYLHGLTWVWTEKVDGMNIRVDWDGERATFAGRTDHSLLPASLVTVLNERFDHDLSDVLRGPVTLYGEGYGAGIQKGGKYRSDPDFILFDILVGDQWLNRDLVADIGQDLGCEVVPEVGRGLLTAAISKVAEGFTSAVAANEFTAEGLVMRPMVELAAGGRVICKVKHKDFGGVA